MVKTSIKGEELIKARAEEVVERLSREFDLGWLKITNSWDSKNEGDRILCETISDFEYRQATFRWNLHQLAAVTDEELEDVAIHEFIHALNAPIWNSLSASQQEKFAKLNELATENVARVISFIRQT